MDITQNSLMQIILLFGSLAGVLVCVLLLTRHGNKKGYIIGPFTYFLNSFLFYLTVQLSLYNINLLEIQNILVWSTVIRLHALIILLTYVFIEPKRDN
jgi:hypothetical protein